MAELNVLSLDLGGSGGRISTVSFDGDTLTQNTLHSFSNGAIQIHDALYWDILGIYSNIRDGLVKAKNNNINVSSIGFDSWCNDFAFIDRDGCMMETPRSYRDNRTLGLVDALDTIIPKHELYMRNGIQFARFNTMYQLVSLVWNRPYVFDHAKKLLFIPDLLNYWLTGETFNEYTIASVSQIYSYENDDWDFELIEKLKIPKNIFQKIAKPCTAVGSLSRNICNELNISPVTVTSVGGHDTASAVVAVPGTGEDILYLSSGTWSLEGTEVPCPIINDFTCKHSMGNEGGVGGRIRLLKNVMGLWIIQECRRRWLIDGKNYSYKDIAEMAAQAKPFAYYIDPDLECFYGPKDMPREIQKYCAKTGQGTPRTDGEIARAVFESLAFKYRYVSHLLERATGKSFAAVNIVGGGSENAFLNQLTANCCKKPVIAGPSEATILGNAIAQFISLGAISNIDEGRLLIKKCFPLKAFEPKNADLWDEHYYKYARNLNLSDFE